MKYLLLLFGIGTFAFASSEGGTDIVPRSVDFVIFVALMYYLLAGKIKEFFSQRSQEIADELGKVDEKIKEAKNAKKEALKKLEEAKKIAKDIEATTAKETMMIVEKIEQSYENEIRVLEKQKEEIMEVSQNKAVREVVSNTLNEILDIDSVTQNKDELIETLLKKVA